MIFLTAALVVAPAAAAQDAPASPARPLGIVHDMVGKDFMLCSPSKHDLCPVLSRGAAIVREEADGSIAIYTKGGPQTFRFMVDETGPKAKMEAALGKTKGYDLEVGDDRVGFTRFGGWAEFVKVGETFELNEKYINGKVHYLLAPVDPSDQKVLKKLEKLRRKRDASAQ